MDERQRTMSERFGRAAEQYATSEQRGGADLERLVELVGEESPRRVLDVATGPGSTALALAAVADEVVGTDVSEGMLETATRRAAEAGLDDVTFRWADAASLPFAPGSFDALTCRIAAHHFPDIAAAVAEFARVLRPDGRIVLIDSLAPDDPEVAAFLHELESRRDPTHVRALSEAEWIATLELAGFDVELVERHPKPKDFESWLTRGGASDDEQIAVRELARSASPKLAEALVFTRDADGAIERFADDKLLVAARRRSGVPVALDHVQLAMPTGEEPRAEAFYAAVLGLTRVPKPPALAVRGGCWFVLGPVQVHLGVEDDFRPARKAHPAFVIADLDALVARLDRAGHEVRWSDEIPDVRRCHVDDPFGNRLELIDDGRGRSQGLR